MSSNMPENDPRDRDPRTQVEDLVQGNFGLFIGAVIIALIIGFVYYSIKSFF